MSEEMTNKQAMEILEAARKTMYLPKSGKYISDMGYALEKGIAALEAEPCEDAVSRGVFEQVMWERDVAIDQLKELGYGFGEKPRTGHWIIHDESIILPTGKTATGGVICSECGYKTHNKGHAIIGCPYNYCPSCGARMVEPQESEEQE